MRAREAVRRKPRSRAIYLLIINANARVASTFGPSERVLVAWWALVQQCGLLLAGLHAPQCTH